MQRLVNGAVEHVRALLALLQSDDLWMEARQRLTVGRLTQHFE